MAFLPDDPVTIHTVPSPLHHEKVRPPHMISRILSAIVFLGLCAQAQTLPAGVVKKASMAGITEYEYSNGLRVLLYPDAASPKITVNVTYLVGSRHEGYGETGMAHLLEHMNFILTNDGRDIKKEIVDHGAAWNGTTSYDRTNYFETVTASDENVKWALGLEAARMVNVRMEKKILDTEMTVVRNEFEQGENSPARVLSERVVATAYLWHNYGKSTIGSRADLERVPIERLAAFYKKFYQPDNAVLTISGKIDATKTLQYVADTVGRLPRPERKLEQTYTVEPEQDGERYVALRRVGKGQEVMMVFHGPDAANADAVALEVLSGIMSGGGGRGGGGGGQGRLTKALVDNKKAVSAGFGFQLLHDPGIIRVTATLTDEQSREEAKQIMLATLKSIVTEPPTKEEVERVKTRLSRQFEQQMADAQQIGLGMTTPISQGDWRLMFLNHDRVKDVTAEDIVRVAKLYLKDSNRTIGEFIPDAAPDRTMVPESPSFDALFKTYTTSSTAKTMTETFEPTPENIEKHVTRGKLANGMKLAVLAKPTATNEVTVVVELRFGDVKSLTGKNATAQFAGSLLMAGTKNKSRQQIQDELEKLNARVQVSGGGGGGFGGGRGGRGGGGGQSTISSASATVTAPAENLTAALKLAAEMLKEPAFPEAEFEKSKLQRIAGIDAGRTEPATLAGQEFNLALSTYKKGDPRYAGTIDEQIEELKKVTLDDVKKFHAQFYGASSGQIAVIGKVDAAAFTKTANEIFGNWKTPAGYQRIVSSYEATNPVNLKIETPDKQNATFEAGLHLRMSDGDLDYPAMVLANYMFGGSITARAPNRIRNKEGLSYGVSSRFTASAEGNNATFALTAISNPKNTPQVESSFVDELKKTLKDGFTAEEVAVAKKAYLDAQKVNRSNDQALVRLLLTRDEFGRTMAWDAAMEKKIESLTPEVISSVFRTYVDATKVTIVKAGDFKAAAVYR